MAVGVSTPTKVSTTLKKKYNMNTYRINVENLKKLAKFVTTIPQNDFSMGVYRKDNSVTVDCNTVGCILGHSTALMPNMYLASAQRIRKLVKHEGISAVPWPKIHTVFKLYGYGLIFSDANYTIITDFIDEPSIALELIWKWLFSGGWELHDNTVEGAVKRINWLIGKTISVNEKELLTVDYISNLQDLTLITLSDLFQLSGSEFQQMYEDILNN